MVDAVGAAAAAIRSAGPSASEEDRPLTVSESTNQLTADFQTFLRLLTAQMRSQDPLNPIDSTEFVAQLAQFSAVEQQVETNKQLGAILESLSGGDASRLAEWLGREVLAAAPTRFDGAPIETRPDAPELDPATAALVVRDADEAIVAEIPFQPGEETVTWDGKRANGEAAPPGLYSFEARFADAQGATEIVPAATYARVTEARAGDDGVELVREGGATMLADDVRGVRAPGA